MRWSEGHGHQKDKQEQLKQAHAAQVRALQEEHRRQQEELLQVRQTHVDRKDIIDKLNNDMFEWRMCVPDMSTTPDMAQTESHYWCILHPIGPLLALDCITCCCTDLTVRNSCTAAIIHFTKVSKLHPKSPMRNEELTSISASPYFKNRLAALLNL